LGEEPDVGRETIEQKAMGIDIGPYNQDPEKYQKLVEDLYKDNPAITLSPEYAHFVKDDLLRLLIRLARYKFVARMIKKTDRLLEVGSGSGLGSIFLAQHCAKVIGMDVKAGEIEEARSINKRKNVEFREEDFFSLDVSEKYDVIVALDVIEHMAVEKGRELISNMARHLEPTGMAVIGTPSIYSFEYQGELSKASHVKCYDQQELVSLVDEYFGRTLAFSMNDELVHTGHPKMAWYYFILALMPEAKE
jgi:SAM-dependent methyltransferase